MPAVSDPSAVPGPSVWIPLWPVNSTGIGQRPGPESSILKVYGTELNQRRRQLAVELAGPEGLGWDGAGFDREARTRTREWLRSRGNTIEGGTSEIQLNIISKHVLGLPDGRKR